MRKVVHRSDRAWLLVVIGLAGATANASADVADLAPNGPLLQLNPVDSAEAPSSSPPISQPQDKKSQSTVVPIPLSDPTLGSGLAVLGMYFHPQTAEEAATQPPSLTAAFGMRTSNGSYVAGVAQTSYWDADRWRFTGLAGYGHLNLDFFGSGAPSASSRVGVRWTVDAAVLQPTIYYRIAPHWYLGGQFRYADVRQTFGVGGADPMTTGPVDVRTSGAGALFDRSVLTVWMRHLHHDRSMQRSG